MSGEYSVARANPDKLSIGCEQTLRSFIPHGFHDRGCAGVEGAARNYGSWVKMFGMNLDFFKRRVQASITLEYQKILTENVSIHYNRIPGMLK